MIASAIAPLLGSLSDEVAALVERAQQSLTLVRSRGGSGSGIVWDQEGVIITNNHVVPHDRAEVVLPGGDRAQGIVVSRDLRHDLAALKVDVDACPEPGRRGLVPAIVGDSKGLRVGELVVALGNPLGLRGAATVGVVSGVGRRFGPRGRRGMEVVQADVDLAPGNSGGPLLDAHGRVVGINTMIITPGMALAVPSHAVKAFIAGESRGPVLGVKVREVALSTSRRPAEPVKTGLLIVELVANGPAERAGLMLGDVLLALNGERVRDAEDLLELLEHQAADVRVGSPRPGRGHLAPTTIEVMRAGQRRTVAVRVSSS